MIVIGDEENRGDLEKLFGAGKGEKACSSRRGKHVGKMKPEEERRSEAKEFIYE